MIQVRYRPSALADLERIYRFIARDNPSAARQVIARIRQAIGRIEYFPHSGRSGVTPDTYELVVPNSSYVAVYVLASTGAEIVAVFHAAQDRG